MPQFQTHSYRSQVFFQPSQEAPRCQMTYLIQTPCEPHLSVKVLVATSEK